jgi:hypothetical protein
MDDGFILVTGKKAGKRRTLGIGGGKGRTSSEDISCKLKPKLEEMAKELKESQFFKDFKRSLLQTNVLQRCSSSSPGLPLDVVCYGIGRLSECVCAQYQLSLLIALKDHMKVERCLVFDPVLMEGELCILEELGFDRILQNEVCRRGVDTPTLFYMVHCSMTMYNNLLWANWSEKQLHNVVLVGNPLSSYHLRLPVKQLIKQAYYIHQILPLCIEFPMPTSFHRDNVFNDTAIHHFDMTLSTCNSDKLWDTKPDPQVVNDNETIF